MLAFWCKHKRKRKRGHTCEWTLTTSELGQNYNIIHSYAQGYENIIFPQLCLRVANMGVRVPLRSMSRGEYPPSLQGPMSRGWVPTAEVPCPWGSPEYSSPGTPGRLSGKDMGPEIPPPVKTWLRPRNCCFGGNKFLYQSLEMKTYQLGVGHIQFFTKYSLQNIHLILLWAEEAAVYWFVFFNSLMKLWNVTKCMNMTHSAWRLCVFSAEHFTKMFTWTRKLCDNLDWNAWDYLETFISKIVFITWAHTSRKSQIT